MRVRIRFGAKAAFACTLSLTAQTPNEGLGDLRDLMSTKIHIASGHDQALLRSPQAAEVVDGDTLRRMGIRRLSDALRLMTSIEVIEADGVATGVSIRSMYPDGIGQLVQILVDGVPLQNSSRFYPLDLDLVPVPVELIDRIEVVRGPSTTLHGANAVAGVIAITTKTADSPFQGALRLSLAKPRVARGEAVLMGRRGPFSWVTAGNRDSVGDSGVRPYSVIGGGALSTYAPSNDGYRQSRGYAAVHLAPTGAWSGWATAGQSEKSIGPDVVTAYALDVPNQRISATIAQVGLGWHVSDLASFEFRLDRTEDTLRSGPQPLFAGLDPGFLEPEHVWSRMSHETFVVEGTFQLGRSTLVAGGDARRIRTDRIPVLGLEANKVDFRGFYANATIPFADTLQASLGLRREQGDIGGTDLAPRFALAWVACETSTFRIGWAAASRSPSLTETLIANPLVGVIANPDLKREKISGWEVGWRGGFEATTWDVTGYVMRYRDAISYVLVAPGTRQYVNKGDGWNRGIEGTFSWNPGGGWTTGLNLNWTRFELEGVGHDTAYSPRIRGGAFARWRSGPWSSSVTLRHVGETPINTFLITAPGGLGTTQREAYTQFNLNAGWEPSAGLTLEVYGRNLARKTTPQGAGGAATTVLERFSRREVGVGISWRW